MLATADICSVSGIQQRPGACLAIEGPTLNANRSKWNQNPHSSHWNFEKMDYLEYFMTFSIHYSNKVEFKIGRRKTELGTKVSSPFKGEMARRWKVE